MRHLPKNVRHTHDLARSYGYIVTLPDGREEWHRLAWQATARAAGWTPPLVGHAPTCGSWRCGHEWRTENGFGQCRLPRDHHLHYVGTPDSHDFSPGPCDCGAAR